MIIDCILDRKEGSTYNAKGFYNYVMKSESIFEMDRSISKAMDYGTEHDIKQALCDYIINNEYNPDICDYVNSVDWL